MMKHAIDHRGTCALGSFNHNLFKRGDIIEQIGGATVQIDEQMFAQCMGHRRIQDRIFSTYSRAAAQAWTGSPQVTFSNSMTSSPS